MRQFDDDEAEATYLRTALRVATATHAAGSESQIGLDSTTGAIRRAKFRNAPRRALGGRRERACGMIEAAAVTPMPSIACATRGLARAA